MRILKQHILIVIAVVLAAACTNADREAQLKSREQALMQKEADFASKEAEYQNLVHMRDSLYALQRDSLIFQKWPEGIEGVWNGKTVCRESDCSDYVVGDQRADSWEFDSDSTGIFTRIISNKKLVRVYSATADSTQFRLTYQTDSSASRKVSINVLLKPVEPDLIRGTQTIKVNDNCIATFSVELVRASKP